MMATIVGGNGGARALVGEPDRRVVSSPAPSAEPAGDRLPPRGSAGAGDVGRFGALGRLYESRGREWAEAVQLRQQDRKLGRFAEKLEALHTRLEQVKLYPPYPLDEPKRAAAIRQFNGVAAEAARLVGRAADEADLPELEPDASTSRVEQAIDSLTRLQTVVAERRDELQAAARPAGDDAAEHAAARISDSTRSQLVAAARGLTRQVTQLLRELA